MNVDNRNAKMNRDIAIVTSSHCYEIRKLHAKFGDYCIECNRVYPCPTIQVLDRRPQDML